MENKPKIALYWCAGCGGCEESVIDMAEGLLAVAEKAEIVFWPIALDARYQDLEALDDGSIEATLINGAIRLDEHIHRVRLLRKKSKAIIAHGACAHMGGVIGLANLFDSLQLLDRAYRQVPSMANPTGSLSTYEADGEADDPSLPGLLPAVKPIDAIITVDAIIPGCPPPPKTMARVITDVIHGRLPASGTVFAQRKALCGECPRLSSKPDNIEITRFKRLYETQWDAATCFLPQGLICLGPVTRGGCDARCIKANMPCRGCFGPTERVADFGAGAMALIAAIMGGCEKADIEGAVSSIVDPTGLFYRYSLAASVLGKGTPQ
jgi:F420-non-reducing hydrogenase small subunit